ncbi:GATA zinc finger domain-containing protein 7 [Condylostylus longicornis]|uniref:GATA zinc finger domain-containing protein 7 n=1 Tax=Condylostylus longicornis TaxID=2530218 RepID=UPI00244E1A88|nr:GATA zinc finger domain-containing protein 7 [Condylostylus longicornis]
MDCVLKCTCPKSPNLNSLQHPLLTKQQNILEHTGQDSRYLNCKSVCDANTSPGLRCIRSPKIDQKHACEENLLKDFNKNVNENTDKNQRYHAKPNPSPRRLISTRNAATSPHLDMRKVQRNELKTKDVRKEKYIEMGNTEVAISSNRASLEKSNSLGESKPNRQLRTTRSLSPRPPVRHQHAIMVSDENDIVSVKVSPSDDYETSLNNNHENNNPNNIMNNNIASASIPLNKASFLDRTTEKIDIKRKHKAKSEQTSPNISDFDGIFTYECKANNKSTGCLIYVPSDPWLKMPDSENRNDIIVSSLRKPKLSTTKSSKLSKETRSLSRGNIDTSDPWVWRKESEIINKISTSNNNIKRSPKQDAYRQSKSFSVTKFADFSISDNNFTNTNNRPKLQRCKSPFFTEDEFKRALNNKIPPPPSSPTFLIAPPDNQYSSTSIYNYPSVQQTSQPQPTSPSAVNKSNRNIISANCSPRKDSSLSFQLQQNQPQQHKQQQQQQSQQINKSLLNVFNPNIMQARHSFSSGSTLSTQKDDELQLNIRRLSEQIKHNQSGSNSGIVGIGSSGGADFSDYLKQFRCSEAKKAAAELAALQQSSTNSNTITSTISTAPSSLTHEQSVIKSPRNTTKNSDRVLETTC